MYRMIQLESLIPETLPGVALFIKHGDNHVLYKDPKLSFTQGDKERLLDNNVKHLFVKAAEMSTYNQYVEANLPLLLGDDSIEPELKQNMLYQASVNYVQEIFDSPAIAIKQNVDRCRNLIKHILKDVMNSNGVMPALSSLVDHNAYTYVHSVQVATYSISLHIKEFDLGRDELMDVGMGSLFHDYGKVYVPKELLDKPGKLSPSEFLEVKKHPVYGYSTLRDLKIFTPVALGIVKHHHEKENGSGYPDGLSSYDIARSSKITAIADVFSALTTNRSYRQALSKESALEIMYGEMDGSFDLQYLNTFKETLH
ncbi:HD domain-containing protein [Geomonas nitrogeniifigens]|uniref:HD domain-containing protein n=1 Tax=Geomonas diazotrophica TaxID=2843197 RepID=A0ABX8JGP0_9BACT|nr:HD domain-containing phosphohydrolase [Geomonas nitrogeniifigens]QWV97535.1 HD domain-containing protein [Geomonas nitrogeniifigens]